MSLDLEFYEFNRRSAPFGFGGELEQILDFLDYKENPNLTDFHGTSLLHFAVTNPYDNFEIIEKLIKAGADVNAQNNCKQTPLHLAVFRQNWRVIDTLIAYDADINVTEIGGNTALHFAIDLYWITKRTERQTQQKTRSWIVRKLLHCGANPNISNSKGETPLMIAVKNGDLDIVRDLLAVGANVNSRNKFSETCLHLISRLPQPDIAVMKELVEHGACIHCYDDIGRTALDVLLEANNAVQSRQKAMSFIKVTTLVNWKRKIDFQVLSRNQERFRSLEGFVDGCYKEISRMKSYVYSNQATLCHFALSGRKLKKEDKSENGIFDEVLETLLEDNFPVYKDVIEAHFFKKVLENKLFEMYIYAKNGKGKVSLHCYAVSNIVSYLSVRDLFNLVRAYAQPCNDLLKNDNQLAC